MLSIKSFYRTCLEIKWYIFASLFLFVAGYFIGAGWDGLQGFIESQMEAIKELSAMANESDNKSLSYFTLIFYNNVLKSIFMMFAGIVFGLFPIFFLVVNGMVIGYLIQTFVAVDADVWSIVVRGLLPHGILEVFAILVAAAFGMRFGVLAIQRMMPSYRARSNGLTIGLWAKKTGAAAVWIAVMLLIAAIIESTITLWLMSNVS